MFINMNQWGKKLYRLLDWVAVKYKRLHKQARYKVNIQSQLFSCILAMNKWT